MFLEVNKCFDLFKFEQFFRLFGMIINEWTETKKLKDGNDSVI